VYNKAEIIRATDAWEPVGPTPMPEIPDLRNWDMRLFKIYKPSYAPSVSAGVVMNICVRGLRTHIDYARGVVGNYVDKYGEDHELDVEAPNIKTVVGLRPESLNDLSKVIDYAEGQCSRLESVNLEASSLECESGALHAGMLGHVVMEAADIAQTTFEPSTEHGPVQDVTIRSVGAPLVMGAIPGIVAFVGCSDLAEDIKPVLEMVQDLVRRKYIVVVTDKYSSALNLGGVINIGDYMLSCRISAALIKIAMIFASLPVRANYEVIADYVFSRVGACGVAWGTLPQEALPIAAGFSRYGIPTVVGPAQYARLYLSQKQDSDWTVMDGRKGELINTKEPSPQHLACVANSKEEAMVSIAKLCIRKNDTPQGRQIKLNHYISLYKRHAEGLPDDLHLYVRRTADIPIFFKKEVMSYLLTVGWEEKPTLSLPTLIGTYPSKASLEDVVH